ncbi:hypothetical protein [Deferribacter desulfuricans]|uniref:hypothetical protein n=1 Tax=Deferribacter desulfuricans TaxID=197162 RepID=UPI00030691E0|nr:hypothetical protein [Deferribacter desulfuricans]
MQDPHFNIIIAMCNIKLLNIFKKLIFSRKNTRGVFMKLGIVIYSDDSEVVWNAFRLGNFAVD